MLAYRICVGYKQIYHCLMVKFHYAFNILSPYIILLHTHIVSHDVTFDHTIQFTTMATWSTVRSHMTPAGWGTGRNSLHLEKVIYMYTTYKYVAANIQIPSKLSWCYMYVWSPELGSHLWIMVQFWLVPNQFVVCIKCPAYNSRFCAPYKPLTKSGQRSGE